jgi:hypothetical protein
VKRNYPKINELIGFGLMATILYFQHTHGSARRDQNFTNQIVALTGASAERIYPEKISGARADRPELAKLMAVLKPDDVVVVTKLDRLGRSTRELLELIHRIGWATLTHGGGREPT